MLRHLANVLGMTSKRAARASTRTYLTWLRIPPQIDQPKRPMPITQNAACRSGTTVNADQRKRSHADQNPASERNQ